MLLGRRYSSYVAGVARRILIKGAWRKSILVGTRDINAEMRSMERTSSWKGQEL
jgi:hypothetical protein